MRSAPLAVLLVLLAGCGEDEAADREQVVTVMEEARDALVAGDGDAACELLTDAGRERAVAFDELGTCKETVEAARRSDPASVEDAAKARFSEPVIEGDRASVDIDVEEYVTLNVRLVRTDDGWRIDDSEAVPVGDN